MPRKIIKSLPKDHADFWFKRLKKRRYADRRGNLVEVPEWQVRMFHTGKEDWFNLGTSNKAAASAKARDIFVSLKLHGWEPTIEKFKPKTIERIEASVGDFLQAVKASADFRTITFEIYARKFRTLIAGVFGIEGGRAKFDYVRGGRAKWVEQINAIRLEKVTTEGVERWKVDYLKAAERRNPLAYKRARVTVNSLIRAAKSLFTPAVLAKVKIKMPDPIPLAGVVNVPVERSRYKSTIDPQALAVAANKELSMAEPEQFKVFFLAFGVGLRRDEIDTLTERQFDWRRNTIRVETNVHTAAKSEASENEVDVDPALMKIFKRYVKEGSGEFIIKSNIKPRPEAGVSYHFRCNRIFEGLICWLRSKGVDVQKPIQTLRKEFGSLIAAQAGIFAASMALRHGDITLTRDFYVDKKVRTILEVGKMLKLSHSS